MAPRLVRMNCNGTIHDDDTGIWDPSEEEDFSWSKSIYLDDHFSHKFKESHTVDGEVRLQANLRVQADMDGKINVSGTLELWEGPSWNMGASAAIDNTVVSPGATATIFEGNLADNEGDWATFKLEVENTDPTGTSKSGLSASSDRKGTVITSGSERSERVGNARQRSTE